MAHDLFKDIPIDPEVMASTGEQLQHWQTKLITLEAELKVIKEEIKNSRHEIEKFQAELKDMALTVAEQRRKKRKGKDQGSPQTEFLI